MSQTRPILLSHSLQKWTEMRNMVIKVADKLPSIMQTCLEKFNPVWKRSHLQCHWWWWAVTEGSPAGVIHHNYTSLAQRVCVCVILCQRQRSCLWNVWGMQIRFLGDLQRATSLTMQVCVRVHVSLCISKTRVNIRRKRNEMCSVYICAYMGDSALV